MSHAAVLEKLSGQVSEKLAEPEKHDQQGGTKMSTTRSKTTKLSFDRPSQYPLPQSLLIAFWGKQ